MSKASDLIRAMKRRAYWVDEIVKISGRFGQDATRLWEIEKTATVEAIKVTKGEALMFLASEREQIMRMSHSEAIEQLIHNRNIDGREKVIKALQDNGIFSIL